MNSLASRHHFRSQTVGIRASIDAHEVHGDPEHLNISTIMTTRNKCTERSTLQMMNYGIAMVSEDTTPAGLKTLWSNALLLLVKRYCNG